MKLGVSGCSVGHWTGPGTGCTVIVFPDGTVASGEVRGGAPATREFAMLDPGRMVERLDAVVLTGGSAFGLAAADGVMNGLAEAGQGFETAGGCVPIVVGLALYDLTVGEMRPGAAEGRLALDAAAEGEVALGLVGAGTGATLGKWRGPDAARPGGLGGAVVRSGELVVACIAAVNASGDIDDGTTMAAVHAGTFEPPAVTPFVENTTLAVVVTNARLDKLECHLVSQGAHDGFARALVPAHARGDGDAVVTAATGRVDADGSAVRLLAVAAVERAITTVEEPGFGGG